MWEGMRQMCQYRYFILKNRWLARLDRNSGNLEPKEFFLDGKWVFDEKLNLIINDCIMDFGDSRWYEYEEVQEETALKFLTNH